MNYDDVREWVMKDINMASGAIVTAANKAAADSLLAQYDGEEIAAIMDYGNGTYRIMTKNGLMLSIPKV